MNTKLVNCCLIGIEVIELGFVPLSKTGADLRPTVAPAPVAKAIDRKNPEMPTFQPPIRT